MITLDAVHVFQGTFCSILPLFQGTFGCKNTKFPFKKERNRQLFPFQKESLFFLYPNLVFLTPICLLFSEFLLNFVQKSKRCRLWQQNSIL